MHATSKSLNLCVTCAHFQMSRYFFGMLHDNTRTWWTACGQYSLRSSYNTIIYGGGRPAYSNLMCTSKCPLKVRIFSWWVTKNAILMWWHLEKRYWHGPNFCILYGEDREDLAPSSNMSIFYGPSALPYSICTSISQRPKTFGVECGETHIGNTKCALLL